MSRPPIKRPHWPTITSQAFQPDNLPRVLASMGFDSYLGTVERGTIQWWRPEYVALPSIAASSSYAAPTINSYMEHRRAELARLNRAMRDSPVHLVSLKGRIIAVDEFLGDGMWRSADGATRGGDLIELAAWRWKIPYEQAGAKLAKVIGMTVPAVPANG